jgi:L-malate glycosyltransferase
MARSAAGVAGPAPILFVHSGEDWIRGSEQCLLDLIAHLDRARFSPVLCCDSPTLARAGRELGVPSHQLGWGFAANHWWPSRREMADLHNLIVQYGVRLIHTNDTDPIKAIIPPARRARIPVVAHLHIAIGEAERRWSMLHQVSFAVGVSRAALQGLLSDGFPKEQSAVIYNGIDPARLEQGDARGLRAELGIPDTAIVLTALGSLIQRKGVDVTLEAFARLAGERSDCHLLFCGSGPERHALENRVHELSLGGRVHFLGERRDAGAILRDATDVLLSASRQEAFPLNLLEAAYFGRPVVASDIDPHREFICDDGPGVLFASENAASLVETLRRLLNDPARQEAMGRAGQAKIRASHLVSHVVGRFDTLYSGLLARPVREFGWVRASRWPSAYTDWLSVAAGRWLRRAVPTVLRPTT